MNSHKTTVKMIASKRAWIEGEAVRQLHRTSELDGMRYAAGLPDLHPGRGNPVGAAFLSEGTFYPYLVGTDVGCGIGLFQTDIKQNKMKTDKWIKKLKDLDGPFDGDLESWQTEFGIGPLPYDEFLGTIGGGNHFAELQAFEKIHDRNAFEELRLDDKLLSVLVHSGSRGIGESLLRKHTEKHGANGLAEDGDDGRDYLREHDDALRWAKCNRALIAHRFVSKLGASCGLITDACHNSITGVRDGDHLLWLHRKGAAPSDSGPIVIPGSRGALSYLVKPTGDRETSAWSLPHGAGRKWNRGSCKERLRDRYHTKSLIQTKIGSHVICANTDLLYEEAPQAYKNIDDVIGDLLEAGLAEIIATMRPIITYKTRKK